MSRMWRVQRRAFADEQRRRDHWHERLRVAYHESGHAIANLAHGAGVERISIDGPPPGGNPNWPGTAPDGRLISAFGRVWCAAWPAKRQTKCFSLGRMANGRRTGSMHGLSRATLIVTT
jgi:hypothetical protein